MNPGDLLGDSRRPILLSAAGAAIHLAAIAVLLHGFTGALTVRAEEQTPPAPPQPPPAAPAPAPAPEGAPSPASAPEGVPAPAPAAPAAPGQAPPPAPTAPAPQPAPPRPAVTPEQAQATQIATEGLQALQKADFQTATAKLQEALHLDPQNVLANTFLGFLSFRNGELDEAAPYLQTAVDVGQSPLALLVLGRMSELKNDDPKALDYYARSAAAGASSPTAQTDGGLAISAHAHYLASFLQRKAEDFPAALDSLEQTLKVFPKNVNAWYEKGEILLIKLKRPADSIECFDHVLSDRASWFAPEAWLYPIRRYLFLEENTHYLKGMALHRAGRLPEAAAELANLTPIVAARFGSEAAATQDGGPLRPLEGHVDLSYYRSHLELARVYSEMGQKGQAVDTLHAYLRIEHLDQTQVAEAKEMLRNVR